MTAIKIIITAICIYFVAGFTFAGCKCFIETKRWEFAVGSGFCVVAALALIGLLKSYF